MIPRVTSAAFAAGIACNAQAALSVGGADYQYAQDFDALAAAGNANPGSNDATRAGWSLYDGAGAPIAAYNAGDGASNAGSFYSLGSAGSGERGLGGVGSGGAYFGAPAMGAAAGWIALAFVNDSGASLAGFTLGYDGERWRSGGNATAQTMSFEWGWGDSFDAEWAVGQTLWLRRVDLNDPGNDHGLAIDNVAFAISAVPEPGGWALMLAGIACLGYIGRRRA